MLMKAPRDDFSDDDDTTADLICAVASLFAYYFALLGVVILVIWMSA